MYLVTENATFRKRSPEWKFSKTPLSCFRMDGENGTFWKRWLHSVGSSLPCEKAARKTTLKAKWRRILCYRKRPTISEYFVWYDSQSAFSEVLKILYSIVPLRGSSTLSSVQNKRVSLALALALRSTQFCPDCDIFKLFPCKFSSS